MDLSTLHMFVRICEWGSVSKAAQELYVSQSALSRRIAALEEEIGVKLLERHSQGVVVTQVGKLFYEDAKKLVAASDILNEKVAQFKNGLTGKLMIGSHSHGMLLPLLEASQLMWENYPSIEVELLHLTHTQITSLYLNDSVDLVYGFRADLPHDQNSVIQTVLKNTPVALVANTHRLASRECVSVTELFDEKIATAERGGFAQEFVFNMLEPKGFSYKNTRITSTPAERYFQIANGQCISISGKYSEDLGVFRKYIKQIPIFDLELDISDICIIYREQNPLVSNFVQCLQKTGYCLDKSEKS